MSLKGDINLISSGVANAVTDGYMDIDGCTINQCADFIFTTDGTVGIQEEYPRNLYNVMANIKVWQNNVLHADGEVARPRVRQFVRLYIELAESAYIGRNICCEIHQFNQEDPFDRECIESLKEMDKWNGSPQEICELRFAQKPVAVFSPELGCFIPGAGLQEEYGLDSEETDKQINSILEDYVHGGDNPVLNRCIALIKILPDHLLKTRALQYLENKANYFGVITYSDILNGDLSLYKAEVQENLSDRVVGYVARTYLGITTVTAAMQPEDKRKVYDVCGILGDNPSGKVLDELSIMAIGCTNNAKPVYSNGAGYLGVHSDGYEMIVLPPVKNIDTMANVSYRFNCLNVANGFPEWIEFTALLDGVKYHKIYINNGVNTDNIHAYEPTCYLDMQYGVPDNVLKKYNYIEKKFFDIGVRGRVEWKTYPDESQTEQVLSDVYSQFDIGTTWKIHQRNTPIRKLELVDTERNKVLGTLITQIPEIEFNPMNKAYVSLDPAGTRSVRVYSEDGMNIYGVDCRGMHYPITPISKVNFDTLKELVISQESSGTHFDSYLQLFLNRDNREVVNSELRVKNRSWRPDERSLFAILGAGGGRPSPLINVTMENAMSGNGIASNMKEMITRSNLSPEVKQAAKDSFREYISIMIYESLIFLIKKGFDPRNITILISYPKSGTENAGVTSDIKSAIYLAINNDINGVIAPPYTPTLAEDNPYGGNVYCYSESEAVYKWGEINGLTQGGINALGTLDYGYSTHDFCFSTGNDTLYTFSIPYAAKYITNETLAKVYYRHADKLVKLFGVQGDMYNDAVNVISSSMQQQAGIGTLYEKMGFVLPLNLLFNDQSSNFKVDGVADSYSIYFKQLVELKLNFAIPAYAYAILRALRDGFPVNQNINFAPVGKGSKALNNVMANFSGRFVERLKREINYLISCDSEFEPNTTFCGNIFFERNIDVDKRSVADGMIYLANGNMGDMNMDNRSKKVVPIDEKSIIIHYADTVYKKQENKVTHIKGTTPPPSQTGVDLKKENDKERFLTEIFEEDANNNLQQYKEMYKDIRDKAFERLVDDYTYEYFKSCFTRWCNTGIPRGVPGFDDKYVGILDRNITNIAKGQFNIYKAQVKAKHKELVMSCPFVEQEMICSAIVDIIVSTSPLASLFQ